MNDAIETKRIGKYLIEIHNDDSPESPREWDNLGTMLCFHRRYNLGDKHEYDFKDYTGWEEMKADIIKKEKPLVILPLFLYDHSGITMSTGDFNDRWDSGQVGFIFVSKKKAQEEYNLKTFTKNRIKKIEEYLKGEVETYDQYLRGDIYGYKVFEILDENEDENDDDNREELDACWGFYGQESCMSEAEGIVKYYLEAPKFKIKHIMDDEKVSEFKTDSEFIHFVRKVAVENEDEELSILSVGEAKDYLENYCDNLKLMTD